MKTRKLHKISGLILLLPFAAWSATAIFFLVRPGYDQAYESLEVKQYPLSESFVIPEESNWEELRVFESILGKHLLVKENGHRRHLNVDTFQEYKLPGNMELNTLLEDAFRNNPERYGSINTIEGSHITTTTGVEIDLNWNTLSFSQEGNDTRWINQLYSIHYLQWTGLEFVDRILGLVGIFLLVFMTYSGTQLAFGKSPKLSQVLRES